jgi:hypothetical protein
MVIVLFRIHYERYETHFCSTGLQFILIFIIYYEFNIHEYNIIIFII